MVLRYLLTKKIVDFISIHPQSNEESGLRDILNYQTLSHKMIGLKDIIRPDVILREVLDQNSSILYWKMNAIEENVLFRTLKSHQKLCVRHANNCSLQWQKSILSPFLNTNQYLKVCKKKEVLHTDSFRLKRLLYPFLIYAGKIMIMLITRDPRLYF